VSKDERQELIKQIYCDALERDAGERAAFMAEACAGDEELRREVEALLGYETEAVNFIETPALNLAAGILAEQQNDAKIGAQIGAYKIISKLGAGGMGEVYLAEDSRLRRKVALKLLPARFVADSERVRRFEREARAASALNHPNILTIYEIGQTVTDAGSVHFIATEFVEGQTLRKRLLQARMSATEALDVITQMAGALQAAHASGIIHRDIKPENVMLRPDGYVKALDFGLARITQRDVFNTAISKAPTQSAQTDPGLIMGTVGYMSPEQVRGEELDERTDIFSLGVVLYEMLAGDRPFKGATSADAIAALLHNEPPPLSTSLIDAPAELQRIVNRALEKDRAARYQRCDEMLADLKAIREEMKFEQKLRSKEKERAADYTTNVLPARPTSAHRRPLRRLPILAFATAVLLAFVGGWFYRRTTETAEWRREKITYLGANDDRALAYLYLPKNSQKPFQTIQFVPAGDVYGGYITLAESVEMQLAPFIRSGRAVWAVVFKGFKEREHPPGYQPPRDATVKRREQVVGNATDLSRGLDYLATRGDIDLNRLAYYGYSRGAQEGLIYAAVENRYRSVALVAGGIAPFSDKRIIAEAAPSNFAPHIKAPKLLLNGRYDEVNPLKTQIEPLFKLLREPKRLHLYDSGHTPPFEIIVPVVNGWLDETLGAVRRF
jgi:serine/threonine protein kinase/dienelactone hydrolase